MASAQRAFNYVSGTTSENLHEYLQIRESRVLQWVQPRAAAVKSLRLRGSIEAKARREVIESAFTLQSPSNWGDFTGYAFKPTSNICFHTFLKCLRKDFPWLLIQKTRAHESSCLMNDCRSGKYSLPCQNLFLQIQNLDLNKGLVSWTRVVAICKASIRRLDQNPRSPTMRLTALLCRNGMAKLFLTVASSLEELVIEYCHPMLTTITFTAMSRLSNLTVRTLLLFLTHYIQQIICIPVSDLALQFQLCLLENTTWSKSLNLPGELSEACHLEAYRCRHGRL